ncbi:MAG: DUF1295 domain-containing protein [Bacteroidales bacterium]|nr:DUF1295 domain-containing protein [Bacteroidales bacterium]
MSLIHEFERSGNILFRYRGQIPVVFFLLAAPVVLLSDHSLFHGVPALVLTIVAVVVSLLGAFIRAYTIGTTPAGTSGRNTQQQVAEALNSTGIYSVVRHPLYLGNYLMWAGLLIFTGHFWFILVISLVYWLYYERIMFAEERFLEGKYGQAYVDWSLTAPAFFPRLKGFRKPSIRFSLKSTFRREYSGWLAMAIGFAFIDVLRTRAISGEWEWQRNSVFVMIAFALVALLLRTLKHNTRLLHVEGRS